jgi:hypothetical protein
MKTRSDIVQTLGDLNDSDRKWIVERLSVTARKSLLDDPTAAQDRERGPAAPTPINGNSSFLAVKSDVKQSGPPSAISEVDQAGLASVRSVLSREPAWIVHALLQCHDWRWQQEFRQGLSTRTRAELSQLEGAVLQFTPRLKDLVVARLAARLKTEVVVESAPEIQTSRLEKLVGGFGARFSRQRTGARA